MLRETQLDFDGKEGQCSNLCMFSKGSDQDPKTPPRSKVVSDRVDV